MEETVLILGAGVFGTSTAYHLSRRIPPSNITIVDRHPLPTPGADSDSPPYGASHDINKIVRSDYSIPFYMELAEEAMAAWASWELIKPFYHRSGWVAFIEKGSNWGSKIRQNYRERPGADPTEDVDLSSAKSSWNSILAEADMSGMAKAYSNSSAGWAEADKAVAAMLDDSISRGVRYVQGTVQGLVLADNGVQGAKLQDGQTLQAGKVLLATGAWTPSIMSPIEDQLEMPDNDRLEARAKAAVVCCAHFALSEVDKQRFAEAPVIIFGEHMEILPPPPSGLLKFSHPEPFLHSEMLPSGRRVPVPWKEDQKFVPEKLKAETLDIIGQVMPGISSNSELTYWRLCWDLVTPEQHQIITRHPHQKLNNLYLAAGGSFHTWKFLPVIGKYVANEVLGESNGVEKAQKWGWQPKTWESAGPGAHEKVVPKRNLADLA